ncbi:hypothetical protein ACKI1O_01370 [Streptomyces scabiei]
MPASLAHPARWPGLRPDQPGVVRRDDGLDAVVGPDLGEDTADVLIPGAGPCRRVPL